MSEDEAKLVATYRESGEQDPDAEGADESEEKPIPKWKFWAKKASSGAFQVPESWLSTDLKTGLPSSEVDTRRKRAGYNELTSESTNFFVQMLGYFRGPILYVMEMAVCLAAGLVRDWLDLGVIIGICMLNVFVSWYQESKAADVVASLKADIAMKATVLRDGHEQLIAAREVVPGDIAVVEESTVIPGDGRIICDYSNPHGPYPSHGPAKQSLVEPKLDYR